MKVNGISQGGQNTFTPMELANDYVDTKEYIPIKPVEPGERIISMQAQGDKKQTTEDLIKKSVDKINKFLQGEATHVEYERHDKMKSQFIIKIIDNKTKEVIKEIPPKKILDMVAEMCRLAGVMFDEKA